MAVPVVGAVAELLAGRFLILLFLILNAGCAFTDERRLRAAGHRAPNGWWAVLLVPVYLWKRATLLQRPKLHFGVWIVSFAVSIGLAFVLESRTLQDAARPVVTEIIREQLGGSAKCIRVRITDDIGGGYYKAVATLDNGNDIRILIEARGDMIYVTIPRR